MKNTNKNKPHYKPKNRPRHDKTVLSEIQHSRNAHEKVKTLQKLNKNDEDNTS